MRDHFIKQLSSEVENNKDIVLVTGDLGFGVFNQYRENYPDNFINAGVAEQNMTGLATGMALEGKTVFTYSIGNFSTLRCLEQIRNDACYHNANVKVVSIGGGFSYGSLGISHHATEDLSIMRSLPDITVFSPTSLWETMEATKACIELEGACYLRLDKSHGPDYKRNDSTFKAGKNRTLVAGDSCAVFVTGGILEEVVDAVDILKKVNIEPTVISVHTLKPFDRQSVINISNNFDNIFSVEENTLDGGLGSALAECIIDERLNVKLTRIGLESQFSSIVGSQRYLRECYGLDSKSIANRIKTVMEAI